MFLDLQRRFEALDFVRTVIILRASEASREVTAKLSSHFVESDSTSFEQ